MERTERSKWAGVWFVIALELALAFYLIWQGWPF
jgi:hypothetical protein